MNTPYGRPTTVDPAALAAHTRDILRLRDLDRAEQKQREGWRRVCGDDRDRPKWSLCAACRRERGVS